MLYKFICFGYGCKFRQDNIVKKRGPKFRAPKKKTNGYKRSMLREKVSEKNGNRVGTKSSPRQRTMLTPNVGAAVRHKPD